MSAGEVLSVEARELYRLAFAAFSQSLLSQQPAYGPDIGKSRFNVCDVERMADAFATRAHDTYLERFSR